jgi:hypothetical protein
MPHATCHYAWAHIAFSQTDTEARTKRTCAAPASCDCWREPGALLPAPVVLLDWVLLERMRSASMWAVTAARASDMAVLTCQAKLIQFGVSTSQWLTWHAQDYSL